MDNAHITANVMAWHGLIERYAPAVEANGDDSDRVRFIVTVETWVGKHYGVHPSEWRHCTVTVWDIEHAMAEAAARAA